MAQNILTIANRAEFRAWLAANCQSAPECWVIVKKGRPVNDDQLWYLDAVEEALCFGWIDSTYQRLDGVLHQRFSPRQKNSQWTELNKERARRLEKLGLMTPAGRAVLPNLDPTDFCISPEVEQALKQAQVWDNFCAFPRSTSGLEPIMWSFTGGETRRLFKKARAPN